MGRKVANEIQNGVTVNLIHLDAKCIDVRETYRWNHRYPSNGRKVWAVTPIGDCDDQQVAPLFWPEVLHVNFLS